MKNLDLLQKKVAKVLITKIESIHQKRSFLYKNQMVTASDALLKDLEGIYNLAGEIFSIDSDNWANVEKYLYNLIK